MSKAAGSPVLITPAGDCSRLERVLLGAGFKDEGWLQALVHGAPELLPIDRIEPGFGPPVPAAREVVCGHGSIDNVYLTPSGEIILVEAKLWRNLQARREVVAQALDYVAALMKLGYEGFEAAVLKGAAAASDTSLYDIVADHPEAIEEGAFIDAVARNLSLGRVLVIVLGDGIREEAETLAGLLQGHAGAHFTFALVELATWQDPATGNLVVLPGTLARTIMIERGILRFEGSQPVIEAVPAAGHAKPKTLTEEMFMEALAKQDARLPAAVRAFLEMIEPLGVAPEYLASLNLKVDLPFHERPTNFGYITKSGRFGSHPFSWTAPRATALLYNEGLQDLIGGRIVETSSGSIYLSTNGSSTPGIDALLPEHAAAWAGIMAQVIGSARAVQESSS